MSDLDQQLYYSDSMDVADSDLINNINFEQMSKITMDPNCQSVPTISATSSIRTSGGTAGLAVKKLGVTANNDDVVFQKPKVPPPPISRSSGGGIEVYDISVLQDEDSVKSLQKKNLVLVPRSCLKQYANAAAMVSGGGSNGTKKLLLTAPGPTYSNIGRQVVATNSILNPDCTKPLPRFLQGASIVSQATSSSSYGGNQYQSQLTSSGYPSSQQSSQFKSALFLNPSMPSSQGRAEEGKSEALMEENLRQQRFRPTPTLMSGLGSVGGASSNFFNGNKSLNDDNDFDPDQQNSAYKTNGLRKYARAVCDKVKEKSVTTYGEVADELVHEYAAEHPMIPQDQLQYIQKNIRRRVYDALNVLMALNILAKEKKEIHWRGLPKNLQQECQELEAKKKEKLSKLSQRNRELEDYTLRLISLKNLILRNKQLEMDKGSLIRDQILKESTVLGTVKEEKERSYRLDMEVRRRLHEQLGVVDIPFIIASTNRRTTMECSVSNDLTLYRLVFDQSFELRDDIDTLRRMGLTLRLGDRDCSEDEFHQCLNLVPPSLRIYVQAIYEQRPAIVPDFERLHHEQLQLILANRRRVAQQQIVQRQQHDLAAWGQMVTGEGCKVEGSESQQNDNDPNMVENIRSYFS